MAHEWRELRWVDLATLEYGRGLRGYEAASGCYQVFGTNGPIGWHQEPLCPCPTVVVGRKGAYRGIHYSPNPCYVIDTAFYLKPRVEFDMRWAYYELLTEDINGMDSGSAIPSTSRDAFYQLPVVVPPLTEQRAIAHILGSLDDKIELNRRMNETLEGIARALFKSWFVDFEPVRAKAEGRDAGLPSHIADLFPDSFEDSELGEIPEGWEAITLARMCNRPQYGFTASAAEEAVGPKFLRITDINKRPWIEWFSVPYCPASTEEASRYGLQPGDILIARMADPGHGVMIEEHVDAVFASYLIRFRPLDTAFGRFFQYWLRSAEYWDLVAARQSGTTRGNLNAQVLGGFQLVAPSRQVALRFEEVVSCLRSRLTSNVRESASLAGIRDTLLPKLMSGELRVPNAEKLVEAAV